MGKKSPQSFEQSLAELEQIVTRMERGDQPLDQTLKDFARGMELSRNCHKSLEQAQLKVEKLIQEHGAGTMEPSDHLSAHLNEDAAEAGDGDRD